MNLDYLNAQAKIFKALLDLIQETYDRGWYGDIKEITVNLEGPIPTFSFVEIDKTETK